MKERKALVEDALHATRAAIAEGIVPGGGVALIRAAQGARRASSSTATRSSASTSSAAPSSCPPASSPRTPALDGTVVVNKIQEARTRTTATTPRPASTATCRKAGIVDPVKVTRIALQNGAASPACC